MAKKKSGAGAKTQPGIGPPTTKASKDTAVAMGKMASAATETAKAFADFTSQAEMLSRMTEAMQSFASEEVVENLTKINESIGALAKTLSEMDASTLAALSSAASSSQVNVIELTAAINQLSESVGGIDARPTDKLTAATKKAGAAAKQTRRDYHSLSDFLGDKFPVSLAAGLGALSGLSTGLGALTAIGKSALGFVTSFAKGAFNIGAAILSIPFKLFDGLINMAHSAGAGVSELATALNNIRKELGSLKGPMATTIQTTAKNMQGFSASGLSAYKVFGNVAERMEKLTQLTVAAGPAFRNAKAQIDEAGGAILGLQRGLGTSDEQMGVLALRAQTMGVKITKIQTKMAEQALGLGKAYDIDSKIISKGMSKAMENTRAFGNVSEKAIGQAVVYAHKLGIDLDKVTSSLDNFATFESAAENVSKLNEVFHTNIDVMEMMNAETPDQQMEIIRKEMARVGVQGEKLSRAERMLMQQTMNWDDATSMAVLSTKSYGVQLSDIKNKSEAVASKQMTQTEAMAKLAAAMELTLKAGEQMQGGFLDIFLKGFADGIMRTAEFREMMMAIRQAFIVVYHAGKAVGKLFVDLFPGVKDVFNGFKEIFNPASFKLLTRGVTDIFKNFFANVANPDSFKKLISQLKVQFEVFFASTEGGISKVLGGFSSFAETASNIFSQVTEYVIDALANVVPKIAEFVPRIFEFLKNPAAVTDMTANLPAWAAPFVRTFGKFTTVLLPKIKDTFFELFSKAGPLILQGFVGLFNSIKHELGAAIKWVMSSAAGMINDIVKFLKQPIDGIDAGENIFGPIIEALSTGWKVLMPALVDLFETVFDKLVDFLLPIIKDFVKNNWGKLSLIIFGPAAWSALTAAGGALFTKVITDTINKSFGAKSVNDQIMDKLGDIEKKMASAGQAMPAGAGEAVADAGKNIPDMTPEKIKSLGEMEKSVNWAKVGQFLVGFAGVMVIGLATFYVAAQMVEDMSIETVGKALAVTLAMAIAAVPVAGALKMLEKYEPPNAKKIGLTLLALGGTMVVLAGIGVAIAAIASLVDAGSIASGSLLILGMAAAAVAVGGSILMIAAAGKMAEVAKKELVIGLIALGVIMAGLAVMGYVLVTQTTGLKESDIKNGLAIIQGMSVAAIIASAAIVAITAAGALMTLTGGAAVGALIAGFVMLAAVVYGLVKLAGKISEIEINLEKTKAGGAVITEAAKVVGIAALAVLALTATGGVMILGGGFGIAGLLAGFTAVSAVLGDKDSGLVMLSRTIAVEVGNMPSDLKPKAEAFTKILDSVAKIMQIIPETLNAMDFGFFEFSSSQQGKIFQTTEMIKSLFGTKGGSGLIGLVDVITTAVKDMTPQQINAATAVGPVLQGAGAIASALGSGAAALGPAFKEIDDDDFEKIPGILFQLSAYMGTLKDGIKEIIENLKGVVETASGIDPSKVEGIKAVGALMAALGPIAQALSVPKESMQFLSDLAKADNDEVVDVIGKMADYVGAVADKLTGPGGLIAQFGTSIVDIVSGLKDVNVNDATTKALQALGPILSTAVQFVTSLMSVKEGPPPGDAAAQAERLAGLSGFVEATLGALATHIPTLVGSISGSLAGALSKLSPEQVALFEPLGKIIDALIKLAVSLVPAPSTPPPPSKEDLEKGGNVIYNISSSAPDIGRMLTSLGTAIPELVGIIIGTATALSGVKNIGSNIDLLLKVFDIFPKIGSFIDTLTKFKGPEGKIDPTVATTFADAFKSMTNFLSKILLGETAGPAMLKSPIEELLDVLEGENTKKILDRAKNIKQSIDPLITAFNSLKDLMGAMKNLTGIMPAAPTTSESSTQSGAPGILGTIAEQINSIFTTADVEKLLTSIGAEKVTAIQGVNTQFKTFFANFQTMSNNFKLMSKSAEEMAVVSILPAVTAAEQMVDQALRLSQAISKLQDISINADVALKAHAAGFNKVMASKTKYVVSSREVVISAYINVLLDAKSIDTALATTKESHIRSRINLLLEATKDLQSNIVNKLSVSNGSKIDDGDMLPGDGSPLKTSRLTTN